MGASASARATNRRPANGHNKPVDQGTVVEDAGKPGVGDKIKQGADDAWAATKAGLQSEEAKLLYLQFGSGVALGAGLTAGFLIVDAIVN